MIVLVVRVARIMLLAGAADPHQIVGGHRRPGGAGGITRRHRPAAAPRAPRDPPRPGRAGTDRQAGLFARTAAADYIYYERHSSPFHQAHIVASLAAHMSWAG